MDQEKVTRVDFMFNAVRSTCIFRPRYGIILQKFKLKREKKRRTRRFVRWVAQVYAVNNLLVCSTIFFSKSM